jgi:Na+-driven multidrug efflux pump
MTTAKLGYMRIFRFWLPLAATWLMMSVEGPFIAAIIARLGAEQTNLAAYGVSFAFALLLESPVIMLMSASTALCRDRFHYRKLRNFSLLLSLGVTLVMITFLLPPVFDLIIGRLLGLPENIAAITHQTLICLLAWPGMIGVRRFYQGLLISSHNTRRVAAATLVRLTVMTTAALLGYFFSPLSGAASGGLALSCGVSAEALLTRYLARHAVREILQRDPEAGQQIMTYREIGNYYLPLALTPVIGLGVHPMVTFFLGKSLYPVESLAVMPVLHGLTFVFRALGLSYQEVAIAFLTEDKRNYREIRNFAAGLGLFVVACLGMIAFTPLNRLWFHNLSGLSLPLSDFASLPLMINVIFPSLTVLISLQRALLIVTRRTKPVSWVTGLEAIAIFSVLAVLVLYSTLPGAVAAAIAYLSGRLLAVAVLQYPLQQQRHLFTLGTKK